MQIPLDASPLGIARLDDAQARGGELVAGLGARDRECDELGEVLQPPLGLGRQGLALAQRDDERAPRHARDADRHADSRPKAERPQFGGTLARQSDVVRPRGSTRLEHVERRALLELDEIAGLEVAGGLAELPDDRGRPCVLEAMEHGGSQPEQRADLLGDVLEHGLGRRIAGDERRHAPQGGLLCLGVEPLLGGGRHDRRRPPALGRSHPSGFRAAG